MDINKARIGRLLSEFQSDYARRAGLMREHGRVAYAVELDFYAREVTTLVAEIYRYLSDEPLTLSQYLRG